MRANSLFILPALSIVVVLGLAACAPEGEGPDSDTATTAAPADTAVQNEAAPAGAVVEVAENDSIGSYLTDGGGRALYLFLSDEQNSGESTCYDKCAEVWPPFLAEEGTPQAGAPQVQATLLDTLTREDGAVQVTYNGWPLYYFAKDQGAGQIRGQDVEGFGAEWYLVSPQGTEAEAEN